MGSELVVFMDDKIHNGYIETIYPEPICKN